MLLPQNNRTRETFELSGLFSFCPDRAGIADQQDWHQQLPDTGRLTLAVPGSWNEQKSELHEFHGEGWYQRSFNLPEAWSQKRVWLRIGSTAGNARVWIDGQLMASHTGPHLPFEFELTGATRSTGPHQLTIAVDNTLRALSLPPGQAKRNEDRPGFGLGKPDVPYDFFPYGGIHRPITLYTTGSSRIEAIKVDTDFTGDTGQIDFQATLDAPDQDLSLRVNIDGQSAEFEVAGGTSSGQIKIPKVIKWSPDRPHLYRAEFELVKRDEGTIIDRYELNVGIRTIKVEGNQLLLNGAPIQLKGFGKHEDFPILGKAWSAPVAVRDFDLMRWTGANSFRTAHYPYAEEMLDLADREGFLVISETPFVSLAERVYTDEMREQACRTITDLITRDCNHPSVILWSLANEPYIDCDAGEHFFKTMASTARAADSTRPIMYVAHETPERNRGAEHYDLLGVNKYFGWYQNTGDIDGTLEDLEACLQSFHEAFDLPILFAEFGADAVAGIHSEPAVLFSEEYQSQTIEKQYLQVIDLPWIVGAHVWNFADFKTAQTINRVAGNKKGVFTRDRQPKLAAHTLRRLWKSE